MNADEASALRKPFPKEAIGRLPKGGAWLDYVGHAAATDRLLSVDPSWTWEPVAFDERGLPRLDESGGLWIRLTVCGVTRIGYGDSGGKKGPNAVKEAIGDALRNAAMRFGVALDLWAKEDLSAVHNASAERVDTSTGEVTRPAANGNGHAADPLTAAKVRITDLGKQLGLVTTANGRNDVRDLTKDYGSWSAGKVLGNASAEDLDAYEAVLIQRLADREQVPA